MSALLDPRCTQLLIIDVQERLLPAMAEPGAALANCIRLAQAASRLSLPITVSQQYPKGIGPTVEGLRRHLPNDAQTLDKMTFSCMRDEGLRTRIEQLASDGRDQVLVCGIEAHVCVLQTAIEIAQKGVAQKGVAQKDLHCFVAADATSSRAPASREAALARMRGAGVSIVTTEMAIFEWLGVAGTADFKALMPLVR